MGEAAARRGGTDEPMLSPPRRLSTTVKETRESTYRDSAVCRDSATSEVGAVASARRSEPGASSPTRGERASPPLQRGSSLGGSGRASPLHGR